MPDRLGLRGFSAGKREATVDDNAGLDPKGCNERRRRGACGAIKTRGWEERMKIVKHNWRKYVPGFG